MAAPIMKLWKQQRNAAAGRRRTLLFQAPEPVVREPEASAIDSRSPWEWVAWVERHDEADREHALLQVPMPCRNPIIRYLGMRKQRELFEQKLALGGKK